MIGQFCNFLTDDDRPRPHDAVCSSSGGDTSFRVRNLNTVVVALTGASCLCLLAMLHASRVPQNFSIGTLAAIELLSSRVRPHSKSQTKDRAI